MSHWLASMHVVVDGWRRLKTRNNPYAQDAGVEVMLASPNVALLNDFRNAVYHFQPEYFSEKFKSFFNPENVVWARRLHVAFERFLDAPWTENALTLGVSRPGKKGPWRGGGLRRALINLLRRFLEREVGGLLA